MTDREITFKAALAAGYTPLHEADYYESGYAVLLEGIQDPWNPLADDGDAFRLAVTLNLGISIPVHRTIRADVVCFRDSSVSAREEGGDPYAATRRAIVRAAAALGEKT